MSELILYHGSSKIISTPQKSNGRPHNDYGQGFYCTESKELASEWACLMNRDGFVNAYRLDLDGLNIVTLKEPYNVLHWLTLLLQHRRFSLDHLVATQAKDYLIRNYLISTGNADVIIGYRADDSYFSFAEDFLSNQITVEQLSQALTLGKLGIQVFLQSQRAFDQLHFCDATPVYSSHYYHRYLARDVDARSQYQDLKKSTSWNGQYIIDLMRKEGEQDGIRLPKILLE